MESSTWEILQSNLPEALSITAYMVGIATILSLVFGGLLGLFLYLWSSPLFIKNRFFSGFFDFIVNAVRSLPFLILMIILIPFSARIVGNPYTPTAGAVSLTVAAIPFFARIVDNALREVEYGVLEAALASGAGLFLIIREVLLPESLPSLIRGLVLTIISILGYSAMLGSIGVKGIGDMAIQYGYMRYELGVLIAIVLILIIIVQVIQWIGDFLAKLATKR